LTQVIKILPDDKHNQELVSSVHPPDWKNPEPVSRYNLVVIGAGTAGLVAAIGGASIGARVALVERSLLGGDCLNTGCVPSKAMIRSSRQANKIRNARPYGLRNSEEDVIDFPNIMERMRRLRARIGHHDSAERMKSFGIDLFLGDAKFTGNDSLEVEGKSLKFKKAVIATGGRPAHPNIEGLAEAGFLTNETVFSLTELPQRLAVIGGGPLGCELAQAFRRFGSEVTIIQRNPRFLPREDRDAAEVLSHAFSKEGIVCKLSTEGNKVAVENGRKILFLTGPQGEETIIADQILVGVGKIPNVEGLNLEAAGVEYEVRKGIIVNKYLQTTNRKIYAAGDVCYPYKFTHAAEALARIVVQNALFLKSKKHTSLLIPWCTYTDPEIAHVGLNEKEARAQGIEIDTFTKHFKDIDRAILDGEEEGFVKIHTKKGKDKILGATIVAGNAGDMISQVTQAMMTGAGLKKLNNVIHPYPTQSDAIKRVAGEYYQKKFSPLLKRLLEKWFAWKR
jgi:pyruvate/2-oxoglutarate dehydrogenase complex dihydrolipoamide dehydrogenase (E3) component